MGSFPVSDLGRLVIFVNKRRLLTEGIGSCILTAHNGLPKYRHIHLMSLLHLLQLAHGQRDFTSSLHSAMVTSRKPMVHWDCYIAPTASRPSRVLDFQSRFGVYNAFSRAIRQSTSHWTPPRQLHRENTGHGAEATAQSPSNYTTVSCPHHVRLAYTKSRRRQALVPQYVSVVASELLRGLESFCASPFACSLRRRLCTGHSGLRLTCALRPAMRLLRTVLPPRISDSWMKKLRAMQISKGYLLSVQVS
jgi:hypothetical protein